MARASNRSPDRKSRTAKRLENLVRLLPISHQTENPEKRSVPELPEYPPLSPTPYSLLPIPILQHTINIL